MAVFSLSDEHDAGALASLLALEGTGPGRGRVRAGAGAAPATLGPRPPGALRRLRWRAARAV